MRDESDVTSRANELAVLAIKAIADSGQSFSSASVVREGLGESSVILIKVSWRENATSELTSTYRLAMAEVYSLSVPRGNARIGDIVQSIFERKKLLNAA
jgi:hypothetical protein